jgi:regulator of nonsense transcripts 2
MSIEQYEGLKRKEENDMLENLKHIWDDFEEDNEEQFTIDDNEDDEDDEDDEDNEDDEVQFTIDKKEGEEKLKI